MPVKSTTTTSFPKVFDIKPKKPQHRDKPKKFLGKKTSKGKKDFGGDDRNDEDDADSTTTSFPEMRFPSNIYTEPPSSVSKTPPWINMKSGATLPFARCAFLLSVLHQFL